jgi:hypothetical protein
LNSDTGTARLVANADVEVIAVPSGGTMSFIEDTPSGLNIISVYFQHRLLDGEVPFVQSRHLDVGGPFPQQYYGTCKGGQ